MDDYMGGLVLVRLLVQRGLAAIYLIAFVSSLAQFRPLLGERGLLPVPRFLARVGFRRAPSIFHLHYSDRFFVIVAGTGVVLSLAALLGLPEAAPIWLSLVVWLVMWALYLSIVTVGQRFYAFGWESMLLEAGFFTAFLGPAHVEPPLVTILILRWMLFRVELGAGLIKLRHDPCWRDLTCLFYHHETQPLPNAIAWYAHQLPRPVLRAGVAFSHAVQLVAPFGLFAPQPIAAIAASAIIVHQLVLIAAGNYAWLNWMTIVLAFTGFGDAQLVAVLPIETPDPRPASLVLDLAGALLAGMTAVLSVRPVLNLFSPHQLMNYNYNALHLVNTYGMFGSVTKERYEVVIEGTSDAVPSAATQWREYGFRGKPGDARRRPPQVAPYHLRLDWLMWFLPLGLVHHGRIVRRELDPWFLRLIEKLLEGDRAVAGLLRDDPFAGAPPRAIRVRLERYTFTSRAERRASGRWWTREPVGEFLTASLVRPRSSASADPPHRAEALGR